MRASFGVTAASTAQSRRRASLCFFCVVVTAFVALFEPVHAAEEIKPPFGLRWGESQERVELRLRQANARIVSREKTGRGERIEVHGLAQRMLLRAFFHFEMGSLEEVELHYGSGAWDLAAYLNFFEQTRSHLNQRYGEGRLIARSKSSQNNITSSLTGYQWSQPGATLQLFLFSAERSGRSVKVLSLHYRGT